jgi:hypothetical protein
MATQPPPDRHPAPPGHRWLKRLGVAGFMFFLVKGLMWLALPALLVSLGVGC